MKVERLVENGRRQKNTYTREEHDGRGRRKEGVGAEDTSA